ncbi:MAG TPA: DUF6644 family protein [Rhodocyclaceae bacterium]|nr:DUF6644 family protein [Rhodocyclaceae bacterium]
MNMQLLEGLHSLPLSVWLRTSAWAYPSLEALHIMAVALVFGTVWLVDLRLLGLLRRLDTLTLAASALPWTLAGFALAATTGGLMFLTQADDLVSNRAFLTKICLLIAAGINAAWLHLRGPLQAGSPGTRAQALASILIWSCVIVCGRMIAYV